MLPCFGLTMVAVMLTIYFAKPSKNWVLHPLEVPSKTSTVCEGHALCKAF